MDIGRERTVVISIHTPAKGVTRAASASFIAFGISIHTPAKGVTDSSVTFFPHVINFNPHPREGGDGINPGSFHF